MNYRQTHGSCRAPRALGTPPVAAPGLPRPGSYSHPQGREGIPPLRPDKEDLNVMIAVDK